MGSEQTLVVTPLGPTGSPVAHPPKKPLPPRSKTWCEAAGLKELAARLARLPPGLEFPAAFPEPLLYDSQRQLLIYRGFMSQCSYTYLRQLSTDAAYLVAVDQLYVGSSYTVARASSTARTWLRLVAAGLLGILALMGIWWYRL